MTDLLKPAATNGSRRAAIESSLAAASTRRRGRLPEIAVGLIVMLGFGLAAVLWQLNATQKSPVLALANDVARGEVIERDDLEVVYLATDDPLSAVGREDATSVIGRLAAADLRSGELLSPSAVLDGSVLEAGDGVVGLALEVGQVPSSRLRAGDLVNVISGPSGSGEEARGGEVIVAGAEVFAVEDDPASGRLFVSLRTTEANANAIAAAAEAGPVRLVWVGR